MLLMHMYIAADTIKKIKKNLFSSKWLGVDVL